MIVFAKESKANVIFANYKNAAAFNLGTPKKKQDPESLMIDYEAITCLPDDDTINAVISGDKKAKKVIKKACKKLISGPCEDNAGIGIGMIQMITMLTGNYKSKKGAPILVFVYDDEEDADQKKRRKFLVEYLKTLFGMFGIEKFYGDDDVKKIFASKKAFLEKKLGSKKARKAAMEAVAKENRKDKNHISTKGSSLQKQLKLCYDVELRNAAMFNIDNKYLKINAKNLIKALVMQYTALNLKSVNTKVAKKLAKKDKIEVKAYCQLREMLLEMSDGTVKLPKVEYGQKKKGKGKKKHAVGEKMNVKKFVKFFMNKSNRALLPVIYAHTAFATIGVEVGSKKYNTTMTDVMAQFFTPEVTKKFVNTAKSIEKDAREKAKAAEAEKAATK